IGLFVCDHIDKENVQEFGSYPDFFAALFPEFEIVQYEVTKGHFPDDLDECDAYMTTGSRHSVYDDLPWINQVKATIRDIYATNKTFVGVCFGHQLLAEALGGRVAKSPNGWSVGVHRFDVHEKQSWMKPFQPSLNLIMMCQDQVLDLPPETKVLAGSPQCPVAIMQIGERMLGIQAHPEYTPAYDQILMEKRAHKMGTHVVKRGIESFDIPVDRTVIRSWILGFWGV
ncbi:MAG: amidotransferase, partial [Bacteroidia bacterium]